MSNHCNHQQRFWSAGYAILVIFLLLSLHPQGTNHSLFHKHEMQEKTRNQAICSPILLTNWLAAQYRYNTDDNYNVLKCHKTCNNYYTKEINLVILNCCDI